MRQKPRFYKGIKEIIKRNSGTYKYLFLLFHCYLSLFFFFVKENTKLKEQFHKGAVK